MFMNSKRMPSSRDTHSISSKSIATVCTMKRWLRSLDTTMVWMPNRLAPRSIARR